ncbi:hypothetical protein [Nostoc sp. FACHB-110]|uniref:hypothetical protein n=1 Tax=Nostoc sp. FACHB-110 TaxID=2692834 RepID=UPI00168660CD|nr:hypothetical protein [Nostoc sp. FACHB-110]MBD2437765.1 hypothetical protein [Nostoc sp. FACHB-110]
MNPDEIETALQTAFKRCDVASCPLSEMQKQILLQVVKQIPGNSPARMSEIANPLDELAPEELLVFLQFVQTEEQQKRTWKVQLLNDWLHNQDSGSVQFIRERYGLQWLNRVETYHFDKYADFKDGIKLKIGDRIEVSNALWEWVQDDGPCKREWFVCTVIRVDDTSEAQDSSCNCTVRFYNGSELEISGVYDWNRYNWRWLQN